MLRTAALAVIAVSVFHPSADASVVSVQGYGDIRLVLPDSETSWLDGGLGKFRYGGAQPDPNFRFGEVVAQLAWAPTDEFRAVAVTRIEPRDRAGIDALELYASYRQSIAAWSIGAKAGAFFPPFSMENVDLGWTTPYTLTPSAINSWIGEELRTIGGEINLERETPLGSVGFIAAAFCCNEPAGVLIADRGWSISDEPTGLFENVRLPDATLRLFGQQAPGRASLFENIDDHVGWYGGFKWSVPGAGKLAIYRYDNEADAAAEINNDHGWRTRFWSIGWTNYFGHLGVIAQGLSGDTNISFGNGDNISKFKSAFALASYDWDDYRASMRVEAFQVRTPGDATLDEDGSAVTGALSWMPKSWMRITGEIIWIDSRRAERALESLAPRQSETQFQIDGRFTF